jgi:hypothetical protein
MSCVDHVNNRLSELGARVAREWRCRHKSLCSFYFC